MGSATPYLGVVTSTVPVSWESSITSKCTIHTPAGSKWPSTCNPDGMALSLNLSTGTNWVVSKFDVGPVGQTAALNNIVAGLQQFHSPIVVPSLWTGGSLGRHQADNATILAPGSYNITNLNFYEGGPNGWSG